MPFADLQSPRSQEFANAPSPDDEEALFTQGFTDLAYKALAKGAPTLRSSVITFRDLEKDVAKGEAVGAFIVRHGTEIVYIPVVLVDNAVKPLDVFYARTVDRFYPLTPQWLDRVDRETVNPMGRAMDAPKNVPTDVDLRSIVIPPTLGRFSYAEVENTKLAFTRVMRELRQPPETFLTCVRQAPNHLKVAMAEGLRRQPRALSLMVEQYGVSALTDALAPTQEKVATSQETTLRPDVRMYSASMPVQEMQRQLGVGEAAHAYSHIRKHGFYIQDTRKSHNALAATGAERLALTTPTVTGLYRVYLNDGSCKVAAVIVNPRDTLGCMRPFPADTRREPTQLLVLFQDGSYGEPTGILAEALPVSQGEFESFFLSRAQAMPSKSDESGVIGHFFAMSADFTSPMYTHNIQRGERVGTFQASGQSVSRVSGNIGGIKSHKGGLLYGEDSFWWPLGERISTGMFPTDVRVISTLIDAQMSKEGAQKINVKVSADQGFIIGRDVLYGPEAIVKVASVYGLNIDDATTVLETVKSHAPVRLWAKTAEPAPAAAPAQDPNAVPMDPAMMGPPMPPPPSGMDLAITEKTQLIQQQIAALQQQAMMLQEVQLRAQGIDGSGGMLAAPQAALGVMGAPPATVGGAQAIAPVGPMPGMIQQQQMAPQQPMAPQMGMPQQPMAPQMMQQPQPGMPGMTPGIPQMGGMDPNQMGGMGPNQMGMMAPPPPPQPVMSESPTPETIANMIDPKFLQDASLLGDPRVFDAAAVASLAKPRALREIFRNYAPTLDAALDKLGRTLILLYTQATELRDKMGDEAYQRIEQQTRDTFRVLGDTLITLEEHGAHIPDGNSPTR